MKKGKGTDASLATLIKLLSIATATINKRASQKRRQEKLFPYIYRVAMYRERIYGENAASIIKDLKIYCGITLH